MSEEPAVRISNIQPSNSIFKTIKNFLKSKFSGTEGIMSFGDSMAEMIEGRVADGSQLGTEEQRMMYNILKFGEMKVSDIMTPRTDIIAIPHDTNLDELKKILVDKEHTRMPVYKESLDNVIGFVHIKDLVRIMATNSDFVIEDILRDLLVVSPSMKLINLMIKMRHARVHMALVLDEYGGTDGLITIEDLVEEIVGEIQDEHDDDVEPDVILLDDNVIEASARINIDKLEKVLNMQIASEEHEDFDTLGGLVLSLVGYIPVKGEKIIHDSGLIFEIIDSDPRRIKRILITKQSK